MPAGRPSLYTEELALDICTQLAEGKSLRAICKQEEYPTLSTVMLWVAQRPEFSEHYAHARELQSETMADDILFIADNEEDVNRAKVQIDARKWIASKLKPKKYGNFQQIEEISKQEHSIAPDTLAAVEQAAENVARILKSSRN